MPNIVIKILVNAVALWVAALVVPGITIGTEADSLANRLLSIVLVALIFGLINAVVKPIVKLFSFPLIVLTLGLFTFIVNALMLSLLSWSADLLGLDFEVDSFFWSAILGALVVSFVSLILDLLIPDADDDPISVVGRRH